MSTASYDDVPRCSICRFQFRMTRSTRSRSLCMVWLVISIVILTGCSSKTYLMPTPTVYTDPAWNPFESVPAPLQSDTISVLYITDRFPEEYAENQVKYGTRRSRSGAFGEALVKIGNGMSWDDVVDASRTSKRPKKIELKMMDTTELARFAEVPPTLFRTDSRTASFAQLVDDSAHEYAERRLHEELASRLAQTQRKEVFIYVHGFNNTFERAVTTTAELWHFLGREGVPICYTWPAGMGLFSYEYTLASTDFTVYHFKQTLRRIAANPDVEKIHIVAHSRGTAVTTDAIRELHLEIRGTADTQQILKLGTVVLAAADLDVDVVIARDATERIGQAVERSVIYISETDKALSFAGWLFGGVLRLGKIDFDLFEQEEIEGLRHMDHLQFIDARVKKVGLGHSYFHNSPAVSSDLVLLLRYQSRPGAEHGRPLSVTDSGMWIINDDYPGSNWSPPDTARGD